jgi:hypothetical protein
MDNKPIKIRDMRHKEKFPIDDVYLNGYAKKCGIYATGVYMSLCRHANNNQRCFPSTETMGKELSISERQVYRAISILENFNIIKRERVGKKLNNLYTLVDRSEWSDRTSSQVTPDCVAGHPLTGSHIKDTHIKDTNIRKISNTIVLLATPKRCDIFPHLKDKEFTKTFNDFILMRKSLRSPMTPRAEEIILNKLQKHDIRVAIRMLENSIEKSWKGVFQLKQEEMTEFNTPIFTRKEVTNITEEQRQANLRELDKMKQSLNWKL